MKRLLLLLLFCIFICGCAKEETIVEEKKDEEQQEEVVEVIPTYEDLNTTPIGIYQLQGNTLTRLHEIHKTLNIEEDIGIFQVYPSNEEVIYLQDSFANSFYQKFQEYNQIQPIKIGFHLEFTLSNGEVISYNILTPPDAMAQWEYLMNYLYDDYVNRGKGFYSHIENDEYTPETLYTAIKLQSSYSCADIHSPILLTVFTYDTEDDFLENVYRGNSQATFKICVDGYEC